MHACATLQGLLRYAAILAGQLRYREAIQLVRRAELTSSDQSEAEFIAQVLSDLTVIGAAGFCFERNSRRPVSRFSHWAPRRILQPIRTILRSTRTTRRGRWASQTASRRNMPSR
jgi:hypothetical protein